MENHKIMKTSTYLILLAVFFIVSCSTQKSTEQEEDSVEETSEEKLDKPPTLTKLWETDSLLTTSESVIYDPETNLLYVSCMNGQPLEKDGNGFISQVNLEGEIVNKEWITGLDAPKGTGIYDGKLYATNITEIVEIDIATTEITNRWEVDSAVFLNDITIDQQGNVFFTDSHTNKIHQLKDGEVSEYMNGENLAAPNGLYAEEGRMMLATMGSSSFGTIDWMTKEFAVKTDSIGAGDGISPDGNGNYLVSSWSGEVFLINGETWEKTSLLRTQEDSIQSADITYIPEKKMLLVPTFFKNSVTAYQLNYD